MIINKNHIRIIFILMIITMELSSLSCDNPSEFPIPENKSDETVITGIELFPKEITIREKDTASFRTIVLYSDGTRSESFDAQYTAAGNLIKIESDGTITGLAEGNTEIISSIDGFESKASITITMLPDYGSLRISEIMCDPNGADTGNEYIEIYNSSNRRCPLSGISITDGSQSSTPCVFASGDLLPHSYIVIAQSPDNVKVQYAIDTYSNTFTFSLNNSGEAVFLYDPNGGIIDSVYTKAGTSDFPAPLSWNGSLAARSGYSISRIDPDTDTNTTTDFVESVPSPGKQ